MNAGQPAREFAYRPPEAYTHLGGIVVVPSRIAALLDQHLRLDRFRKNVRGQDAELDAVLLAIRLAAVAHSSAAGTIPAKTPEPQPHSRSGLMVPAAAIHLGISDRAVRKAMAEGRLSAQKIDGRWSTSFADIEAYRANRAA